MFYETKKKSVGIIFSRSDLEHTCRFLHFVERCRGPSKTAPFRLSVDLIRKHTHTHLYIYNKKTEPLFGSVKWLMIYTYVSVHALRDACVVFGRTGKWGPKSSLPENTDYSLIYVYKCVCVSVCMCRRCILNVYWSTSIDVERRGGTKTIFFSRPSPVDQRILLFFSSSEPYATMVHGGWHPV